MPRSGRPSPGRPPPGRRTGTTTGDLSRIGARRAEGELERGGRGAPYLVPLLLAVAVAAAAWVGRGWLSSLGQGLAPPEVQVRQALERQERAELDDVYGFRAGGTAELSPLRFEDVAAAVDGDRATVTAMLRAEGRVRWRDRAADLAYLGRERFQVRACAIARWCADGEQFARLRGVLTALFRHRDAVDAGDAAAVARLAAAAYREGAEDGAALGRRLAAGGAGRPGARVRAWQIRVDRDRAEVGEDLEPAAPGARPERRVYVLVPEDGRWRFAAGL